MDRQETAHLHKESAGLQNKRVSRTAAKAKTEGSTRPKLPAGPGFMPRMGMERLERLIRATMGCGKNQGGGGPDEKDGNEVSVSLFEVI